MISQVKKIIILKEMEEEKNIKEMGKKMNFIKVKLFKDNYYNGKYERNRNMILSLAWKVK
jgi:hypothetical protein